MRIRVMFHRFRLEIVLVVVIAVLCALYVRALYIPSFSDRHVEVSEERYGFDVGDPGPWFSAWALGDGQAYVLIALDPTGEKLSEEVSVAAYRFVRAGYGWAVWAVSLGRADLVPYALAAVGSIAVIGVVALAVNLRARLGARAWFLVINPALYIGFAGDTSEPLGILLLALTLASGSWVTSLLLGVTRPTFLVALWGRWRLVAPGAAGAIFLAAYALLSFRLDGLGPTGAVGFPFAAYVEHASIWGIILVLLALATLVVGAKRRDWAWVVSGLFVICFGGEVLANPVNAWRAAGFLPVLWAFGPGYEVPGRATSRRAAESSSAAG